MEMEEKVDSNRSWHECNTKMTGNGMMVDVYFSNVGVLVVRESVPLGNSNLLADIFGQVFTF